MTPEEKKEFERLKHRVEFLEQAVEGQMKLFVKLTEALEKITQRVTNVINLKN